MNHSTNTHNNVTATLGIDVEDWYHVENLRRVCPRHLWSSFESRVERNVDRMLQILDRSGTKVTFFILGAVAQQFPNTVVRKIADAGHELASHGFAHEMLDNLTDEQFRQDVAKSKSLIEDIAGTPVLGYRAPNFSIRQSALDILAEVGFRYDSSFNPTRISRRYGRISFGLLRTQGNIFRYHSICEIPMSTFDLFGKRVPMAGGGYLRLYPYAILKSCAKKIIRRQGLYNCYIHPWEIDPGIPRMPGLRFDMKFRHYLNLSKGEHRFTRLVHDFNFGPLCSLLPPESASPQANSCPEILQSETPAYR